MDPGRRAGPVERAPTPSERNQFAVTYNGRGVAGLLPTARRLEGPPLPTETAAAAERRAGRRVVVDALSLAALLALDVLLMPASTWLNGDERTRRTMSRLNGRLVNPWPRGHVSRWPHGLNTCVP